MKNKYLTVIARMKAKSGKESELRKLLLGLVEPTRKEIGCVNYDLHESNETPGLFYFYENWTDAEALAKHFKTPHLTLLGKMLPDLLGEPLEVHQLTMISPASM